MKKEENGFERNFSSRLRRVGSLRQRSERDYLQEFRKSWWARKEEPRSISTLGFQLPDLLSAYVCACFLDL